MSPVSLLLIQLPVQVHLAGSSRVRTWLPASHMADWASSRPLTSAWSSPGCADIWGMNQQWKYSLPLKQMKISIYNQKCFAGNDSLHGVQSRVTSNSGQDTLCGVDDQQNHTCIHCGPSKVTAGTHRADTNGKANEFFHNLFNSSRPMENDNFKGIKKAGYLSLKEE